MMVLVAPMLIDVLVNVVEAAVSVVTALVITGLEKLNVEPIAPYVVLVKEKDPQVPVGPVSAIFIMRILDEPFPKRYR